jgi:hypothetical protein
MGLFELSEVKTEMDVPMGSLRWTPFCIAGLLGTDR